MNGKFIADATSLDRSETLAAVLDAPFLDDAAASRRALPGGAGPTDAQHEASRLVSVCQPRRSQRRQAPRLADVFWVLLNSSEFILNH